jgi:hypothetical protein
MIMDDRRGISQDFPRSRLGFTHALNQPDNGLRDKLETLPNAIGSHDRSDGGIDAFALRIHQSLDLQQVMSIAVGELRRILECDRVIYLECRGKSFRVTAVSGHAGSPRRSQEILLLERLVAVVLSEKQRFLFPDENLSLPDDIGRPLADYWDITQGQFVLVEPVFQSLPASEADSVSKLKRVTGALVIEQFERATIEPEVMDRLDAVVRHLTPALENARKYQRLVTIPGLYQLGLAVQLFRRNSRLAVLGYFGAASLILLGASLVQRPFEIECRGRLMPIVRREVFAGIEGEVVEVNVNESESVEEGQLVCVLRSRDLEKSIIEQTGLLNGKFKARDAARAELRGRSSPQGRSQNAREQAQLELVNAEIETIQRQLKLLEQQAGQLEIRSPISGTVMTERPFEKLKLRPVRRGESLLEIMQDEGGWQLELTVAEQKIGHLLTYHRDTPSVSVDFRMLSAANKSYECQVTRWADRTVPTAELGSSVTVFCDVTDVDSLNRQVGSEVTARIQCGRKSLLFLWFHEFWELLQRNWWV